MIDVRQLTKQFGARTAVDALSFQVDAGEIFGLLGPNGAGKTTTMRLLCCLIAKTSGEAAIAGYDVGNPSDSLKIRQLIGLVPDNVGLYEELSAAENLDFYAKLYQCPAPLRTGRIEHYLRLFGLWEQRGQPVGDFSKGMKQKLAVARALIHDPQVLFLDEPTANLDPEAAKVVTDVILDLKQQGKTIFLNTHKLEEAERLCDRIGILRTRLLALDTPARLKQTVWGTKTVLQLGTMSAAIVAAVRTVTSRTVTVEGSKLIVDVADPETENPPLAQAVVAAGGRLQYLTGLAPDLEETYLRIVSETP
jgi:ABC-2 type transport system ATP-binding protein